MDESQPAAPDLVEPILGWRVWVVRTEGRHRLGSVVQTCLWPAHDAFRAACLDPARGRGETHRSPARTCRCGIYAFARVEEIGSYVGYPGSPALQPRVVGLVSLWGSVLECERGWRASRAYPHQLWLPETDAFGRPIEEWEQIALDLADYGIPLEPLASGASADIVAALRAAERRHRPEAA